MNTTLPLVRISPLFLQKKALSLLLRCPQSKHHGLLTVPEQKVTSSAFLPPTPASTDALWLRSEWPRRSRAERQKGRCSHPGRALGSAPLGSGPYGKLRLRWLWGPPPRLECWGQMPVHSPHCCLEVNQAPGPHAGWPKQAPADPSGQRVRGGICFPCCFFKDFFDVDFFFLFWSLLNLLQYCFCFLFCFFDPEACGNASSPIRD